jgi:dihydropteroate synthase
MRKLKINGKILDLRIPQVMGILNVTPDSFYDGGKYLNEKNAVERAAGIISEGGSIIDAGGFSTRPGASLVPVEEERKRIIPVLRALRKEFPKTIISIDTYRAVIAGEAIDEGADIINDVSGGTRDKKMIPLVVANKTAFVLMHMKGDIGKMPKTPRYANVVKEVKNFFKEQIRLFPKEANLILDPGFGFGKSLEHNYQLLNGMREFTPFNYPVMAGVSRKSIVNRVIAAAPVDALNGTTAVHMIALAKGANILRVHDIKEAVQAIKIHIFAQSNPPK